MTRQLARYRTMQQIAQTFQHAHTVARLMAATAARAGLTADLTCCSRLRGGSSALAASVARSTISRDWRWCA